MRSRWRLLFWISLLALVGLSWTAQRLGISMLGIWTVPFLGMVLAAVIAFVAMIRVAPDAWPAAAVLAAAAPMGFDLYHALAHLGSFIDEVGFPAAVFIGGAFATIAMAVFILVTPNPK